MNAIPLGNTEHQDAWKLDAMVEKFAHKTATDFFRSETRFMPAVSAATSVLDVGCASGRLVELLHEHLEPGFRFTGVDVVADSIERARASYPELTFLVGDFLELMDGPEFEPRFDFINATGVVQHEPRYRPLIDGMIDLADRWVLFDAKVAPIDEDLIDRDRAHVTIEDTRLYFNVLAFGPFLEWLRSRPKVTDVSVFGYRTEPNQRTTVPDDLGPFASAGVLVTVDPSGGSSEGPVPSRVELDVPDFLTSVGSGT